jgi:hypothetical protein
MTGTPPSKADSISSLTKSRLVVQAAFAVGVASGQPVRSDDGEQDDRGADSTSDRFSEIVAGGNRLVVEKHPGGSEVRRQAIAEPPRGTLAIVPAVGKKDVGHAVPRVRCAATGSLRRESAISVAGRTVGQLARPWPVDESED